VNGRCEREPRVTREGGSVRAQSRQRLTSPCKSTRSTRPCPWLQQLRSRHTATTSAKEALAVGCTASAPKMIDANIGPAASAESDQGCPGHAYSSPAGGGPTQDVYRGMTTSERLRPASQREGSSLHLQCETDVKPKIPHRVLPGLRSQSETRNPDQTTSRLPSEAHHRTVTHPHTRTAHSALTTYLTGVLLLKKDR